MYFLYNKLTGAISEPIRSGEPSEKVLNKEADCELGSGIRWNEADGVDLFYAPDEDILSTYPDFLEVAINAWGRFLTGKYFVYKSSPEDSGEIKLNPEWYPEPEE